MKFKRFVLVGVLSLAAVVVTVGVAGAATAAPSSSAQAKPFWSAKVHQKGDYRVEKDLGRGKVSPFETAAGLLGVKPEALRAELKSGKSLNDLIAAKGLDPAKFSQDLQAAFVKNLDQAVKDGKLTQEKADVIKAKLPQAIQNMLTRKGGEHPDKHPGGKGFHGEEGGLFFKGVNDQVQILLGLDQAALKAELKSGKSLADIAQAKGISQLDLEAKVKAAVEANLDQAVKDGKLTADQAAKIKANLPERVKAIVTRTHTEKGPKPLQQEKTPKSQA